MSTNYTQKCMVGVSYDFSDYLRVLEPAVVEMQNRYDENTGKIKEVVEVLVKREVVVVEFDGVQYGGCFYEASGAIAERYSLEVFFDRDTGTFVLGYFIGEEVDCGRADLLQGDADLTYIVDLAKRISALLDCNIEDVGIHFLWNIG